MLLRHAECSVMFLGGREIISELTCLIAGKVSVPEFRSGASNQFPTQGLLRNIIRP